jgi:hypothetical protein
LDEKKFIQEENPFQTRGFQSVENDNKSFRLAWSFSGPRVLFGRKALGVAGGMALE